MGSAFCDKEILSELPLSCRTCKPHPGPEPCLVALQAGLHRLAKNLGLKPCRASPCDSSRASALAGLLRRGLVPSCGGSSPALQRGRGSPRGERSGHGLSASCQADTLSPGAVCRGFKALPYLPDPRPRSGLKAVHLLPGRRLPEGLQPPQGWPGALVWEGAWVRGPTSGPKVPLCFCSRLWCI